MTPEKLQDFLRQLADRGILNNINGLLFGKPGWGANKIDPARVAAYDQAILAVFEQYRLDKHIVTNMPIGHTYPMGTWPIGLMTGIYREERKVVVMESAVDS
jgi:muramoyltetrapeptide carboxypeptidase LdcA involved in peptidoglycan recycling